MQKRSVNHPGSAILVVVLLIINSISSDDPQSFTANGKNNGTESLLLRDHGKLASVFNIISDQCRMFKNPIARERDEYLNVLLFNYIDSVQLTQKVKEISEIIELAPSYPLSPLDNHEVIEAIDAIGVISRFQASSRLFKWQTIPDQGNYTDSFNRIKAYNWTDARKNCKKYYDALQIVFTHAINSSEFSNHYNDHMSNANLSDYLNNFHLFYTTAKSVIQRFESIRIISSQTEEYASIKEIVFNKTYEKFKFIKSHIKESRQAVEQLGKHGKLNSLVDWLRNYAKNNEIVEASPYELSMLAIVDTAQNDTFLKEVLNKNETLNALMIALSPMKSYLRSSERLFEYIDSVKDLNSNIGTMIITLETIRKSYNRRSLMEAVELLSCFKNAYVRSSHNLTAVKSSSIEWFRFVDSLSKNYSEYLETEPATSAIFGNFTKAFENLTKMRNIQEFQQRITELRSNREMQTLNKTLFLIKTFPGVEAIGWNNNLTDQIESLAKFVYWMNSTDFGSSDFMCRNLNHNRMFPLEKYSEILKNIDIMKENNNITDVIDHVIRPLRLTKVMLDNTIAIADEMRKSSSSHHIFSIELCQQIDLMEQDHLLNFAEGVESLGIFFEILNQKGNVRKLLNLTNIVIRESEKIDERSRQGYLIKEYFQIIKGSQDRLEQLFQAIEQLELTHKTGNRTNLTSISQIYKDALKIENPIDWSRALELMDRFPDSSYENEKALVEARRLVKEIKEAFIGFEHVSSDSKKSIDALEKLDYVFYDFFKWSQPVTASKWKLYLTYFILLAFFSLLLIVSIVFVLYMSQDPMKKRKKHVAASYNSSCLNEESRIFWPQLNQECRLYINQRDESGKTELFRCVEQNETPLALSQIECAPALDAACDRKCYTSLHLAVMNANGKIVDALLKNGADQKLMDSAGKRAEQYYVQTNPYAHYEDYYIPGLFAKYYDNRGKRIRQPQAPRNYYILIVERSTFPEEYLEMLPKQLEIVYGYKEGEVSLDDFTHFVLNSTAAGSKDLLLDLDKTLMFEMLSKPGMIVSTEWLDACLNNPNEIESDWKFLLTNITFEGKTHENVIFKIKNDIHRLRPPLFDGCAITVLATRNEIMQSDREAWIRIIEGFGGTYTETPRFSNPTQVPYHARRDVKTTVQSSIILYFSDSIIKERWRFRNNGISLIGMGWLPESIVRYRLINPLHKCLKYEAKRDALPMIYETGDWSD